MTDDLVKRLRGWANADEKSIELFGQMMRDAADRIVALEAALRWIKEMPLPAPPLDDPAHSMRAIAARALKGTLE